MRSLITVLVILVSIGAAEAASIGQGWQGPGGTCDGPICTCRVRGSEECNKMAANWCGRNPLECNGRYGTCTCRMEFTRQPKKRPEAAPRTAPVQR